MVLERDLPWLDDLVRAKPPVRLPVVLSEAEVRRLLEQLGRSGCALLRNHEATWGYRSTERNIANHLADSDSL